MLQSGRNLQECQECRAVKGLLNLQSCSSGGTDPALDVGSGSGSETPAAAELCSSISTLHKLCSSIKEGPVRGKQSQWKEMPEVIKYGFSGEMMQVVNENVT